MGEHRLELVKGVARQQPPNPAGDRSTSDAFAAACQATKLEFSP